MALSDELRKAIERDKRTIPNLADDCGVGKSILSRFTRSLRTITLPTAEKILEALGFEVRLVRKKGKAK